MRCAAKAAKEAAAHLRTAGDATSQQQVADDTSSAAVSSRPAAPIAAGARGTSPRADDSSPLEPIYSCESDGESDSKKTARSPGSPVATKLEPSKKKSGTSYKTALQYSLLGSDDGDDSDQSSPISIHSHSREWDDNDGSRYSDREDRGTGTSVGTTQEALDRNVLRLTPRS